MMEERVSKDPVWERVREAGDRLAEHSDMVYAVNMWKAAKADMERYMLELGDSIAEVGEKLDRQISQLVRRGGRL